MPHAKRVCSTPGCPELVQTSPRGDGRCPTCRSRAEQHRGTARQRGYDHHHETRFRRQVLTRDPLCTCTSPIRTPTHRHTGQCLAPSTVADHHPHPRTELTRLGLDPNNPDYGRGLCKPCHDLHTALTSPGGWHNQPTHATPT